ncbi:putative 39S mitochondrial ribosomal protein L46 [Trypanosoma vivax]|nr:putative 39S mitochondrial ribosomal protein L46 [Trypanosoma vivax]
MRSVVNFGALRIFLVRSFHSQHRTPVLPQLPVTPPMVAQGTEKERAASVRVAYFLHRYPVVKPTPHPLEMEMAFLLQREHQRYCRHESADSATQFMAQRGQSIDVLNRTDTRQIQGNFFGLELYQDAMRVMLQRYKPERRVTPRDLWDPAVYGAEHGEGSPSSSPPARHTLQRQLDDYLHLIVRDASTGKWTLPQTSLHNGETLRMAVDRAIANHSGDELDCYLWSNAPQAVVRDEDGGSYVFVFVGTYLAGRPKFATMEPKLSDHAWVTRHEMLQYGENFHPSALLETLRDISADSAFES